MIKDIPKISVLVITYNQEDVISRAIESLLSQKDYIYEICVSDDCSKDGTWEILQEYDKKYPGLFVLNRNEPNIGIFENIEKTWAMPSGDVIYQLAGDDECGAGWFKTVVDYILKNQIDYQNGSFCIYGDYKAIYPNGDQLIYSNYPAKSEVSLFSLALRGYIGNRSACFGINVLNKFFNVSKQRSFIAECAQDRQLQIFSDRNFYIPYVGNIYYARIGVSVHLDGKRGQEHSDAWMYLKAEFENRNINISKKDCDYIYFLTARSKGKLLKELFYGLCSIDKHTFFYFRKYLCYFLFKFKHQYLSKGNRIYYA